MTEKITDIGKDFDEEMAKQDANAKTERAMQELARQVQTLKPETREFLDSLLQQTPPQPINAVPPMEEIPHDQNWGKADEYKMMFETAERDVAQLRAALNAAENARQVERQEAAHYKDLFHKQVAESEKLYARVRRLKRMVVDVVDIYAEVDDV